MRNISPLGRVILVGAGPGDPELLTLKAVRALQIADVVLVDDLVHDDVLVHANPQARIVHVGKRGGCKSTPQEFIERLLIAEAQAGRVVVRLKGGDPFVFGRGGEERAHLESQGVRVDVVPGITSGLAAAAALGVPVTHRDIAHGCIFVTGHGAPGASIDGQPRVDWRALAATGMTLVIYMGVSRVASIQSELLAAGLAPDLPVAVIQNATLPTQRQLSTTLAALEHDLAEARIGSPAVMIVGEVARKASLGQLAQQAQAGAGLNR